MFPPSSPQALYKPALRGNAFLFGYDAIGVQTSITYPDGKVVTFTPDAYDRIVTVKVSGLTRLTITYNTDDKIATEATSDGQVTTYTYNNRDWVTKVETKKGNKVLYSLTYTYDDVGNVKTRGAESFTHDWLNRLTSATGGSLPEGLTYAYDEVGNIISKGDVERTYGNYNKLISDGTYAHDYSVNGNVVSRYAETEFWSYTYNSLDQLTEVSKGVKKAGSWTWTTWGEYWYDANMTDWYDFTQTTRSYSRSRHPSFRTAR